MFRHRHPYGVYGWNPGPCDRSTGAWRLPPALGCRRRRRVGNLLPQARLPGATVTLRPRPLRGHRAAAGIFVTMLGSLVGSAAVAAGFEAAVMVNIHATLVPSFMGLGIQWDPYAYPPSPDAWALTVHRVDAAKPAFFRVMLSADRYCTGFDTGGTPHYVWMDGESAVRSNLGSLLAILDYAQSRAIDVMLGEWAPPHRLGSDGAAGVARPDDPRWSRLVTDAVTWLVRSRGYTVVRYYNLMNEPNGSWMWLKGQVDYDAWAAGVRRLRTQFDAHGLADLPIVGPDNSGSWGWIDRVAREMPATIGGWEVHWYATDREIVDGQVETLLSAKRRVILANDPGAAGKRFFLGECGLIDGKCNADQQPRVKTFLYGVLMADFMAQVVHAGWMGMSAWDMDDAMHVVRDHPAVPGPTTLKIWGFWNTQGPAMGKGDDERIRPWFYTWSLMSRLFPRGTRIVATDGAALPHLRVVAGLAPDRQHVHLMLVNDADDPLRVRVAIPGIGVQRMALYHYFAADHPVDAEGFATPAARLAMTDAAAGFAVSLPGRGVVCIATE
jgi:hypothetical protein